VFRLYCGRLHCLTGDYDKLRNMKFKKMLVFMPLRVAQCDIAYKRSIVTGNVLCTNFPTVSLCVSVCAESVHGELWKLAVQTWMRFGVVSRVGPRNGVKIAHRQGADLGS